MRSQSLQQTADVGDLFDEGEHQFLHGQAVCLGVDFPNVCQQELGGLMGFCQSFPFALGPY